jgi:hypothetical protein
MKVGFMRLQLINDTKKEEKYIKIFRYLYYLKWSVFLIGFPISYFLSISLWIFFFGYGAGMLLTEYLFNKTIDYLLSLEKVKRGKEKSEELMIYEKIRGR